jgi:hypothetical protein
MVASLGLIGWQDADSRLVMQEYDVDDPRQQTLMELFAAHCPECRRALAESSADTSRLPRGPWRRLRSRRHASNRTQARGKP